MMHQINSEQLPNPNALPRVYHSDGLWLAHCAGPFYYLGTQGIIWGLVLLQGGNLTPSGFNDRHDPAHFATFCELANSDDSLMMAALSDHQEREDGPRPTPFPVFLGD